MANPYGIEQVDVPAAIGAFRQGQHDRISRMEAVRAEEKARRDQEREDRITATFARFTQPNNPASSNPAVQAYAKGGDPSSVSSPATPPALAGGETSSRAAVTAPALPSAPPQASNLFTDPNAQQQLISQLSVIDAPTAMEYAGKFSQLGSEQRLRLNQNMKFLASEALNLRNLQPGERAAALQSHIPRLRAMGVSDDMISQLKLDDASLEGMVNYARDMEAIIDQTAPKAMPLTQGGSIGEYTPPSPFPAFGGQGGEAPAANAPFDYEQSGVLSEADSARMKASLGPNGEAKFEAWKKQHNVVESKRLSSGQMAYKVNGKWYDNPEGR